MEERNRDLIMNQLIGHILINDLLNVRNMFNNKSGRLNKSGHNAFHYRGNGKFSFAGLEREY